jgi:hypothetical protein
VRRQVTATTLSQNEMSRDMCDEASFFLISEYDQTPFPRHHFPFSKPIAKTNRKKKKRAKDGERILDSPGVSHLRYHTGSTSLLTYQYSFTRITSSFSCTIPAISTYKKPAVFIVTPSFKLYIL